MICKWPYVPHGDEEDKLVSNDLLVGGGGARTCFHVLNDICCVEEACMVFAQPKYHLS